ncbi:MAG: TonB-dependent receptor, partial [Burkholderiales bacterium]|nr:TonB-dependent receptor [Burkholderiales bacterium]
MQFKFSPLHKAALQALAGTALAAAAMGTAQAQSAGTTTAPAARVEITGSRILRVDAETPSPVQVITSADLQKSGYTTIAEVLQGITANGQGTLSQGFSQAFASGASGISLRGLTTAATLVLIDGHRMAPYPLSDDGQRSFVDVSNIPFDAVERIEVLKDGASATYGSDAMAGVVNIILKKSFTGTRVSLEGGGATEGGGGTVHASVIHGFGDYDADGYTGYVALEFRHQNRITYNQRAGRGAWQVTNWTAQGGISRTPGVPEPYNNPQPATLSPYLTNPSAPSFSGDPTSSFFYGGACPSYAALQAGNCAYQNPRAEIQPQTQNANFIASFSKKLSSDFRLDLKGSLFDSRAEQYPAGALLTYPSGLSPIVAVSAGVTPYIATPGITSITVPSTYPGNPFGVAATVNGVIPDAPIPHTMTDSKATRVVADLNGSIGVWDIGASLGYTKVSTLQTVQGLINVPALNAALNRSAFPFNVTGGNNASDIANIFPSSSVTDTSKLTFGEFHLGRSLMALKGGDMQLSTGLSYIDRNIDSPAPPLIAQGVVNGNNAYVSGGQKDTAIYGEVVAPVLKSLEIDGDLRYDHFNNAGNSTTPKLGFKWKPLDSFALRGTVSRGFRAPNAAENGQSGQAYLVNTVADPVLCPNGPNAAGAAVNYCSFQPVYLNSANPTVKAEKSTAETLGVILEPIRGWSSTFDLYQIKIDNQIVAGQPSIATAVRSPTPVSTLCSNGTGGTVTCSVNPILYIPVEYVNANSTKTSGWELGSSYRYKLGSYGSLLTELNWSHTMSYVLTLGGTGYQLAGTHGPLVIGGDTGNPKDKAQLSFTWNKDAWQVATAFNWMSSFDLTDPSFGITNCDAGASIG